MARLAGVTLPKHKRVDIALTYIFGIGRSVSLKILEDTKIEPGIRTKDLTAEQVNDIKNAIEKGGYLVEGELRRDIGSNIKRLKDIGSYRGDRHQKRLPVRGQRTKNNNRTVRGNVRRTMGSGKKGAAQKT